MVDHNNVENETNSDTTVSLNLCGATIALSDDDSENDNHSVLSDDNNCLQISNNVLPPNTSLNVENSSDVIVGPVTQFHGPVTIYQNTHNNAPRQCDTPSYLTNGSLAENSVSSTATAFSSAKLVSSESLPGKPIRSIPFSRKKITIISLLVFVIIVLLTIIISYVVGIYINNENNEKVPEDDELNKSIAGDGTKSPQIPNSQHKLIYRDRWGGRPPLYERPQKVPVKYVIISHTASAECFNFMACSKLMQQFQSLHVDAGSPDIGYNFLIGGDGNIYVGRDWDNHNFHMNRDTIGISFIGNYIYNTLNVPMKTATLDLLKRGVDLGKLTKDYIIVAHNQTWNTQSPGRNAYNEIKFWPHFSSKLIEDIPESR